MKSSSHRQSSNADRVTPLFGKEKDMHLLYFVMFLLAVVCFVASALKVVSPRVELVSLGLALTVAVFAIQQVRLL